MNIVLLILKTLDQLIYVYVIIINIFSICTVKLLILDCLDILIAR